MRSPILGVVAKGIVPVATLAAIYLLLRGHNAPGGGFVAGLIAAAALVLQVLAFGHQETKGRVVSRLRPTMWLGLAIATLSGTVAMLSGYPWLKQIHGSYISTTLIFDIGVFMVVVGAAANMLTTFASEHP